HKDMQASYVFKCQNSPALDQIDVKFMQAFQGIEKLDVNLLIGSKAKSVELKAGLSVIKF
ncbi:ZrgA family zinc uptake protein, partial [Neptuniibacter sp. UBA847]